MLNQYISSYTSDMVDHYFFPNIFPSSIYIFPNIPFNKFFYNTFYYTPSYATALFFHFEYSFYKFFYTPLFTLHPLHSYFFKFPSTIFPLNFTVPTWFHERYISQTQTTNFETRNLHFEMTNIFTPSFTYNVINHYIPSKQKKKKNKKGKNQKKILLYKFSWRFLRRLAVINRRTIALNTDTSPIHTHTHVSYAQWQDQPYRYMK